MKMRDLNNSLSLTTFHRVLHELRHRPADLLALRQQRKPLLMAQAAARQLVPCLIGVVQNLAPAVE